MGPSGTRVRWLSLALLLAAVLAGCAPASFGGPFDRCHQAETERDTLYLEIYCRLSP